jgi:hypothetical protein
MNRTSIAQEIRARTDQYDSIRLKSFWTSKESIARMERQPTELVDVFAKYSSDKGLIPRIYKELKKIKN